MLAALSLISIILVLAWLSSEFRGRTFSRVALGFAALCSVAVMAFLWGTFVEAFKHAEFPEPHDSPADTAIMDAAEKTETNSVTK
jgi:hypothetical protein